MDEERITWQGYEHQPLEKSTDWFWALGIFAVASAATAVILGNVLFGILIITAGVTMSLLAQREHRLVTFSLDKRGLHIDDIDYPLEHLNAYWIREPLDDVSTPLLLIDTPRVMTPDLAIPLTDVNPESVHMWFAERGVPEIELRESFSLKVLEFFGF